MTRRFNHATKDLHLFDEVAELGAALHPSRTRPDNGERQSCHPLLVGQRREISSLEAVPECLDNTIETEQRNGEGDTRESPTKERGQHKREGNAREGATQETGQHTRGANT